MSFYFVLFWERNGTKSPLENQRKRAEISSHFDTGIRCVPNYSYSVFAAFRRARPIMQQWAGELPFYVEAARTVGLEVEQPYQEEDRLRATRSLRTLSS